MKKSKRDTKRIGRWSHEHRDDKEYRKAQVEGTRRYREQLYRDAAFGRVARTLLGEFGELFKKLVAEEEKVDRIVAEAAAGKAAADAAGESPQARRPARPEAGKARGREGGAE